VFLQKSGHGVTGLAQLLVAFQVFLGELLSLLEGSVELSNSVLSLGYTGILLGKK